ncbi:alpha/beta hydrolase [Palleronia sp. LCG004]|uniref:alpha/beta hydrolase n=1 Tax=Palleronia sp. LCG004 TaxID=3079304 RepID=UPI0029420451|nr:alpha/beta hydrolase-fold protein [Palleronia sp. LCG004]WOI57430.1 alpha/beta hydrolase-fold protein [Palleronia sp. LCG004]
MILHVLRTALPILLAILWAGAASAQSANGTVSFDNTVQSRTFDRPVSYALYLPPGYATDTRAYPVVYLLHGGATGQPSDWFTLAQIDQVLDRLIAEGRIPPVIAVAPDGRRDAANRVATYFMNDADGIMRWEDMFHDDFVPAIELRYRTLGAEGNRTLLGISMGGVAATFYQLRRPEVWAGAAALGGAFRTEAQIDALSAEAYEVRYGGWFGPGLTGEARLDAARVRGDIGAILGDTDKTAFQRIPLLYLDIGADDPFFEGNALAHMDLRNAGIRHRFVAREGGHDWPYWRDGLDEALLHLSAILTRDYGE